MAFVYRKNLGLLTGGAVWYNLKELLKTAGWTVKSSGDGLSAFSSSSDVITVPGTGAGGMSNANAWFRIQMPTHLGVTRELLVQAASSSTITSLLYSFSAGFTGGSPSATVAPTATDSKSIKGSAAGFLADNSYHMNMGADDAAPYGFFMASISVGNPNSAAGGGLILDPILENSGSPGDPDPYVWTFPGTNGFTISTMTGNSGGGAWYGKGTGAEVFTDCSPGGLGNPSGGNFMYPNQAGTNPHTMDEEIGPILYGHSTSTLEPIQTKGIGTVMKWNGTRKSSGSRLSVLTTGDRICIQEVNFPWDGSAVAV